MKAKQKRRGTQDCTFHWNKWRSLILGDLIGTLEFLHSQEIAESEQRCLMQPMLENTVYCSFGNFFCLKTVLTHKTPWEWIFRATAFAGYTPTSSTSVPCQSDDIFLIHQLLRSLLLKKKFHKRTLGCRLPASIKCPFLFVCHAQFFHIQTKGTYHGLKL